MDKAVWKPIRQAMNRENVESIVELAQITGIAPSTLMQTRRQDPGSFKLYELAKIDEALHLTNEEWLQIRGVT